MDTKKILIDKIQKKRYLDSAELFLCISKYNYSVIKGEPLSVLAYNELGMRSCSDIDILVEKSDLVKIESLLIEQGFISNMQSRADRILTLAFSHQVVPWHKNIFPFSQINIDLNFDIFWGEYEGKRVDIKDFLSDAIEMDIYGIKVKTLPPLKAMIQLVLHHYKEMNSIYHLSTHNCIHYKMFKDIYYLWKNNREDISLDKLYSLSNIYEIFPYIYYVLYFTNQVFNDAELEQYVDAFKTLEGINLLDYYGLAENERKLWKIDFKTRLESDNLYDLIKDDLTTDDFEKLERNRRIFG